MMILYLGRDLDTGASNDFTLDFTFQVWGYDYGECSPQLQSGGAGSATGLLILPSNQSVCRPRCFMPYGVLVDS